MWSRKCWCFEKVHTGRFSLFIIRCIGHPPISMRAPFHATRRANRGAGRHTSRRHASEFHTSSPKTIGRFEDAPRPALAWRRVASRTRRSLAWLGRVVVVVVRRRATARPVIGATVREARGGGWSGRSHLAFPPTDASANAIVGPGFLAFIVLFFVRFHRDSRGRRISCSRRSDTAPIRRPLASA
jgi:hypothetical protein